MNIKSPHCIIMSYILSLCLLDKWSPALQIRTVLLSIQALLSAPNPDDPLANDVAELWKVNGRYFLCDVCYALNVCVH